LGFSRLHNDSRGLLHCIFPPFLTSGSVLFHHTIWFGQKLFLLYTLNSDLSAKLFHRLCYKTMLQTVLTRTIDRQFPNQDHRPKFWTTNNDKNYRLQRTIEFHDRLLTLLLNNSRFSVQKEFHQKQRKKTNNHQSFGSIVLPKTALIDRSLLAIHS
jgi:hypothetical protein